MTPLVPSALPAADPVAARAPAASASASAAPAARPAATSSHRPQQTQWRRNGSCQMGGVWNTNRFFVRRQFG